MLIESVITSFHTAFGYSAQPLMVRSPGRINIIGEHTDYNEGFVLPAAIDKCIYMAIDKSPGNIISLFSVAYQQKYQVSIDDLQPTGTWASYILGVADQLLKRGYPLQGFNLLVDGDIPAGAGLSSSAAVECAAVFALNELFGLGIAKMEMVKIAQEAEQCYTGVMCGIMDQFASIFGRKDQVIKLDCHTLAHEYIPLKMEGYKMVLLNTNVQHSLSSSAYNTRREQCAEGVALVKKQYPAVNSLRDVTIRMLDKLVAPLHPLIYKRCQYVVGENIRLLKACEELKQGKLKSLGKEMFLTHEGLSRDYEVSCKELDFLVEAAKNIPGVLGARMMGAGFGGCTINLVQDEAMDRLVNALAPQYKKTFGIALDSYTVSIENGTSVLEQ